MDVHKELLQVLPDGFAMIEVLKRAKAAGHTQSEVIEVLTRLFWEASRQKRENDEDIIVDVREAAYGFCAPEYRIWEPTAWPENWCDYLRNKYEKGLDRD